MLPLFLVLALALVQTGLVLRAQILVVEAARAGARAASVDPRDATAVTAAQHATSLATKPEQVELSSVPGDPPLARVVVRYRVPIEVPIIAGLLHEVTVTGTATMAVESAGDP